MTVFKHLTSFVMLIGDLWDGFFYPTLILMIDDYNPYNGYMYLL